MTGKTRTQGMAARLNTLLRGELAASDTYFQAIDKVGNDQRSADLCRIHQDHCEAVSVIEGAVRRCGERPEETSDVWGAFATATEESGQLLNAPAAIDALKRGEEQGINNYEAALITAEIPKDFKTVISSKLLPQAREHLAILDRLTSV